MNRFLFPKQTDVNKISVQYSIPNTIKRTFLDLHSDQRTVWGCAKKWSWKQKKQKASPCSSLDRSLWDTHTNHFSCALKYPWDCNIYFCFCMVQKTLNKILNDLCIENSNTAYWTESDQRAFDSFLMNRQIVNKAYSALNIRLGWQISQTSLQEWNPTRIWLCQVNWVHCRGQHLQVLFLLLPDTESLGARYYIWKSILAFPHETYCFGTDSWIKEENTHWHYFD